MNSLVGTRVGEGVGNCTISLGNGNYLVCNTNYYVENGAGSLTWGDGNRGTVGAVSPANSLVGTTANDHVGYPVTELENGGYFVLTEGWDNGSIVDAGAVTLAGSTGVRGEINASNSVVGTVSNGQIRSSSTAFDSGRERLIVGNSVANVVSIFGVQVETLFKNGFE
jgi:Repeat of unknown function (DUF5650)